MTQLDVNSRIGIPKGIRERLGLKKGVSNVEIFEKDGDIIVRPLVETFNVTKNQMEVVRKLYNMIKDIDLLETTELKILKEACYISDVSCPKCGTDMYYTKDKRYECPNCK